MSRLDRHIVTHVLSLIGMTALALLAIQTFVGFVSEVDQLSDGFRFIHLVQYTLLLMPTGLLTLLPMIALLGTLLGMGVLAGQGELVAMRASGVSVLRMGRSVLIAGLAMAILTFSLSDWIAPQGEILAEKVRAQAKYGVRTDATRGPVWLREQNRFVQIRSLIAEDHVADVWVYTMGEDGKIASVAEIDEATYSGDHWKITQGRATRFLRDQNGVPERTESLQLTDESLATTTLDPNILRLYVLQADGLNIAGLLRLVNYLESNGLDTTEYKLSIWRKIITPLTVMVMMLFALPFVLGPLRDSGAGQRLFFGILLGLGFWVINEVAINSGQLYGWHPAISAGLPTAALLAVATWRLARFR